MRYALPLSLQLALSFLACGDDPDGADPGSGGALDGTGGASDGLGGAPGDGGTVGQGGAGGSGGSEEPGRPCAFDQYDEQACTACVIGALTECGRVEECTAPLLELSSCAQAAGCFGESEIDYVCAGQACPSETAAAMTCVSNCPALLDCGAL